MMHIDEALERARAGLAGVRCTPVHEILEVEEPPSSVAPLVATDEVDFERAVELYRAAKGSGLSAIIVPSFEDLQIYELGIEDWPHSLEVYEATSAEELFARRAADVDVDVDAQLSAALDKLGALAGRDPMSVLHRILPDDLAALESGEDELDIDFDDLPLPDDVREAHAQELAERAALIEHARRAKMAAMLREIRTYDEPTALAELGRGAAARVRVVLAGSQPFLTLLALGFGGFNECPTPAEQARVWQHWAKVHGAEPVVVRSDGLDAVIARPVESRAALVRFVCEIAIYDRDALTDGTLALAARVYRNSHVTFWWD